MYIRDKTAFITYCSSNVSHRKGVRLKAKQVKPFYILLSNKNQVLKTGIGGKGYKSLGTRSDDLLAELHCGQVPH